MLAATGMKKVAERKTQLGMAVASIITFRANNVVGISTVVHNFGNISVVMLNTNGCRQGD